mgnify:CR=1 FL=1
MPSLHLLPEQQRQILLTCHSHPNPIVLRSPPAAEVACLVECLSPRVLVVLSHQYFITSPSLTAPIYYLSLLLQKTSWRPVSEAAQQEDCWVTTCWLLASIGREGRIQHLHLLSPGAPCSVAAGLSTHGAGYARNQCQRERKKSYGFY